MKFSGVLLFLVLVWSVGCGVKGDPLPPDVPAQIGRGRPTFQKAVKDVAPAPVLKSDKEEESNERKSR